MSEESKRPWWFWPVRVVFFIIALLLGIIILPFWSAWRLYAVRVLKRVFPQAEDYYQAVAALERDPKVKRVIGLKVREYLEKQGFESSDAEVYSNLKQLEAEGWIGSQQFKDRYGLQRREYFTDSPKPPPRKKWRWPTIRLPQFAPIGAT